MLIFPFTDSRFIFLLSLSYLYRMRMSAWVWSLLICSDKCPRNVVRIIEHEMLSWFNIIIELKQILICIHVLSIHTFWYWVHYWDNTFSRKLSAKTKLKQLKFSFMKKIHTKNIFELFLKEIRQNNTDFEQIQRKMWRVERWERYRKIDEKCFFSYGKDSGAARIPGIPNIDKTVSFSWHYDQHKLVQILCNQFKESTPCFYWKNSKVPGLTFHIVNFMEIFIRQFNLPFSFARTEKECARITLSEILSFLLN